MKICSVCSESKSESEYYFRDKRGGRLHSQCKICYALKRKSSWKDYYYRKGSKYRENAVNRNRKLKNILRENMVTYLKDRSCVKCGNNDARVLEFDHIDPSTKSFSIARAINDKMAWNNILAEMAKCQILCANCHKIKTSIEQGWYKNV